MAQLKKSHAPSLFGQKVAQLRQSKGKNKRQLAKALGVSESYVSLLESGKRNPSRKIIKVLVNYFYPQGNPPLRDEWLLLAGFSPESPLPAPVSQDPLKQLESELQDHQEDIRSQFALIRGLIKTGEHERAKKRIQACFQVFEGSVEVQSLVGSLELAKGHYAQAIQAQQTALDFYQQAPESARISLTDLLLSLGVSWFLKGYDELTAYHQKQQPEQRDAAQQSFLQARSAFQQALAQEPEDIYVLDEYARVCFNLAHLATYLPEPATEPVTTPEQRAALWQETLASYQQVMKHRDNRLIGSQALLENAVFLGHAHAKSGDFAQAENVLSLVQALRPDYWLGHYARACLLSLRCGQMADHPQRESWLDEALEHLTRALRLDTQGQAQVDAQSDPDLADLRQLRPQAFQQLTQGEHTP